MNNNIVFDNDPFNHIDIFHFTDFDSENIGLPRQEDINNLKVQSGHLALLNPTILKDNDIEGQLDIAMRLGIGGNKGINIHKINNEPLKKTTEKKTVTRSKKIVTKKEKESEDKKLQPKKRGRKATTTKTSNDDSEDECNVKLPQKFQYLEEKERAGTLTEEEEKILKKERRLIKNRESAQQFRKRQKMHTIELQDKVDNLTDENIHLKHTVEALNKDKDQLEMQIKNLWQFVNKAFTFAVPYRVEQQNNTYQNGYHYSNYPPQHHPPQHHLPPQNHIPHHPIHNTHHNPTLINSIPHNRNSN